VATVAGRVEMAGAQVAKRKPPENLVAYDYVLRGLEQLSLKQFPADLNRDSQE
jgi:adenylate cyclase